MGIRSLFKPTLAHMAGSLVTGVILAIGHHLFYRHLAGTRPPDAVYAAFGRSSGLTGQQLNLAVGSAFAFLVKAFLGMGISLAHDQATWRTIKARPMPSAFIDGAFAAKTSLFDLLNLHLWKRSVSTMLLAVVYWLLPLTVFFPPATLTVQFAASPSSSLRRVPRLDFTSTNYANLLLQSVNIDDVVSQSALTEDYYYSNAQFAVQAAVAASLTESQILPVASPALNATWMLAFPAPALSCSLVGADLYVRIAENIVEFLEYTKCAASYGYLCWTPDAGANGSLPFDSQTNYTLRSSALGPVDSEDGAALSLFVAVLPGMEYNPDALGCIASVEEAEDTLVDSVTISQQVANATIAQCKLYNASYTANFTYVEGSQAVDLSINDSYYNPVSWLYGLSSTTMFEDEASNGTFLPGTYNTTIMETFSYQAVMEAFNEMLLGGIAIVNGLQFEVDAIYQAVNTNVVSTGLMNTKEMAFLNNFNFSEAKGQSLTAATLPTTSWNGLSVTPVQNHTLPIVDALEEMFRNATISLMNSYLLQPNYSSPYAPPETNVTITPYYNRYVYSQSILWLSYGIGIILSLLAVVSGILCIWSNQGTYTTQFSTFLRVAKGVSLSTPIFMSDTDGKDPTPRYIKDLVVEFPDKYTPVSGNDHDE
ncbi:hypothetical protein ASPZODRAFT_16029 [Penicilliopsis zonata CBS 506.65]|uniref:Uncharacterized protein n=1 Tax=Penicilliopsis zonata CBS 506.65 TaxID=1073090 RepID=A0A1L9SJH8_9EURO|nr:hypothetical protein ASPZODRAFT_16029 [Penicilliopsis zonata CBS 506.65]OJJ47348.1 hypothetical protein ASPZODRAFT_16029 [Penicilliopsis zonata CBS 506.65]